MLNRRKFDLEEDDGQLPLPLAAARKRIDDEDPPPGLPVLQRAFDTLLRTPEGAVTEWSSDMPPSSGFWEVRQKSARTPMPTKVWFDMEKGAWVITPFKTSASENTLIQHADYMQAYTWRGLAEPAAGGYTYPLVRNAKVGGEFVDLNPHAGKKAPMPPTATRRRLDL